MKFENVTSKATTSKEPNRCSRDVTPRSRNTYLVAYSDFRSYFSIYFLYWFCIMNSLYDCFALDPDSWTQSLFFPASSPPRLTFKTRVPLKISHSCLSPFSLSSPNASFTSGILHLLQRSSPLLPMPHLMHFRSNPIQSLWFSLSSWNAALLLPWNATFTLAFGLFLA